MGLWANVPILKKIIQVKLFKVVILEVFIIQTKPELVGGKMDIQSILQKF